MFDALNCSYMHSACRGACEMSDFCLVKRSRVVRLASSRRIRCHVVGMATLGTE
jgi:hypothetical protein